MKQWVIGTRKVSVRPWRAAHFRALRETDGHSFVMAERAVGFRFRVSLGRVLTRAFTGGD